MKFPGREFVIIPVAVILFAIALHWVYADLISPQFDYLGYRYREPAIEAVIISVCLAIVTAVALPRLIERASSVVLWVLYVVTVAPTILMATYTPYRDDAEGLILGLVVALVFVGVCLGVRGTIRPVNFAVSPTSIWIVLIVISLVTYVLLGITQGLSFSFVALVDVYDLREEYAANLEGIGILSYLVFIQANVVNPLMVARGLFLRNHLWTAWGIIGQLILYSTTGFKGMLFAIPAWLIIAFILRRRKHPADGLALVWGASALIIVSAFVDSLANSPLLTSLLSRRFLATPGVFTQVYVEFFSNNPQVHLGHSILRPFVDYPYQLTPPYVIGEWMAGLPTMAANANMFADGFANFGWAGLIGAGVVLLVYLRILDKVSVGLPIGFVGVIMTMPTVALSNTSILTAMLSHGLVAAVVLLAIVPRDFDTQATPRVPPGRVLREPQTTK
ncbi:hypothetical protein [Microbacterium sp. RD11]|nr:hypothetical protein [Microbacterium sp. RD11]MDH5134085.1 hypothetical protein [Microbacterium sp. RD10]MDH5146408.1 hypothetical protein [Microbacterium sp. RD12]MDH5155142.1 hypothetical protein [Microbacterium sp. RD06]MDH5166576.1 hypothetical protein [Microbacterium sp. RD02]MDH5136811.1 hypothetical protein [Microbacterium sp. RD11]